MKKSSTNYDRPWVKFYKPQVKANLTYSSSSMVGYLLDSVARFPEYIAYEYYGKNVTYREFYEEIRICARSLKAQGVKPNDKVVMDYKNEILLTKI